MINKTKIFFHVATIGDYQRIVNEIFNSIYSSDLKYIIECVMLCIVGDGNVQFPFEKNIIIKREMDVTIGEFFTLNLIKQYSDVCNKNENILYIHTKGVTSPYNQNIEDWRNYMIYFNITEYEKALNTLNLFDSCGVDFVKEPSPHYSGNFWWSNTDYIKTLPKISEITNINYKSILTPRHNAEFWIGMGNGNHFSLFNSNINVYERHLHRFDKEKYI